MQYIVPAPSPNILALEQTVDAGASILFNGNPQGGNFFGSNPGGYCERKVALSSDNDLSGVNFTIRGLSNRWGNQQRGVYQTETMAGPNNGIEESNNYFSSITSITVDADAADVSVGSGFEAAVLIYVNSLSPRFGISSFSFSLDNPGPIHFSISGTNYLPTSETLNSILADDTGIFEIVADSNDDKYQFPYELAKLYPAVQTIIALLNTQAENWVDPITINYFEA